MKRYIEGISRDQGTLLMQALAEFSKMAGDPGHREIDLAAAVESFVATTAPGYADRCTFGRAIAQVTSGNENTAAAWFAGMVSGERVVEPGDLVMLEAETHLEIPYRPGTDLVRMVVKNGAVVVS